MWKPSDIKRSLLTEEHGWFEGKGRGLWDKKKTLFEYINTLPLCDPDLFTPTPRNTFPVLSLPCLPETTSRGLCILEAAKHVVYSDLKNPSMAFSIYFQALYNLRTLTGGKARGKVQRNSINNTHARAWKSSAVKKNELKQRKIWSHWAGASAGREKGVAPGWGWSPCPGCPGEGGGTRCQHGACPAGKWVEK